MVLRIYPPWSFWGYWPGLRLSWLISSSRIPMSYIPPLSGPLMNFSIRGSNVTSPYHILIFSRKILKIASWATPSPLFNASHAKIQ